MPNQRNKGKSVHLAIDRQRLESLIKQGKLHADDFSCLDRQSKQTVWGVLLSTAASNIRAV
ncbi:hypothetical protein MPL1_03213 [Methylophaga lonarensis MPL]|uniref:Transposase n=1 Tax=Methylophaga lonarensis MPL TaxID=1286106 RepID=M7P2G5_9GAMM|nr:hypothetical protein [Methylophaga lonarensis]EMR13696.1 hypothetical protein MPL1_03213 [Methylophaga lonarensis MPL]MCC5797144.1 hypothetical protein [Methylophaga sp.]